MNLPPELQSALLGRRVVFVRGRLDDELANGVLPATMQLDHLCRERACCNPAHLEPVTQAENIRRGEAVKTHCPQGHPYEGDNLYIDSRGKRRCKTCIAEQAARRYARKKAEA